MTLDNLKTANTQKAPSVQCIPLSVPCLKGNEWTYVKDCLDTGWVSSVGEYVNRFEESVAKYVGRKYAVACVNGTSAIHVSLMAAGIGPGDEVIMPDLTFVAPANAVKYQGAYPVFIDVDPEFWQLDVNKLKDFLMRDCELSNASLRNKKTGRYVKAVLPVHLLGHPVNMGPLMDLAREFNLFVIEDAAESIGAEYKGKRVGNFSDLACFSFNGNKVVTAGGGGVVVTDDKELARRIRYLTTQAKDDPVEYIHHAIGCNYRLTNIQAAIGLAQMELLDQYLAKKLEMARLYNNGLKGVAGVVTPQQADWARSIYWLYTILIDQHNFGMSARQLLLKLQEKGIQSRPLWKPLHELKPFQDCYSHSCHTAIQLYAKGLSIPSSIGLTFEEQNYVIKEIVSWSK